MLCERTSPLAQISGWNVLFICWTTTRFMEINQCNYPSLPMETASPEHSQFHSACRTIVNIFHLIPPIESRRSTSDTSFPVLASATQLYRASLISGPSWSQLLTKTSLWPSGRRYSFMGVSRLCPFTSQWMWTSLGPVGQNWCWPLMFKASLRHAWNGKYLPLVGPPVVINQWACILPDFRSDRQTFNYI